MKKIWKINRYTIIELDLRSHPNTLRFEVDKRHIRTLQIICSDDFERIIKALDSGFIPEDLLEGLEERKNR